MTVISLALLYCHWKAPSGETVSVYKLFICLALQAGKMNQILHCDCLPEWARLTYLAHSGLPAVSCKKNSLKASNKSFIDQVCLVKTSSRWLDIGLILFLGVYGPQLCLGPYKHAKKELGKYPAILSSHSITHMYCIVSSLKYLTL